MSLTNFIYQTSENLLFIPFLFLLAGSIYLSFKTRFIQIRLFPKMLKLLWGNLFVRNKEAKDPHAIQANKALFTAMATTIGIGAMIAPIIAIGFGGPGALLGFVLATLFGGASTFTEVTLAMRHRKRLPDGTIAGGPMQYIKDKISPKLATIYAILSFILIAAWQSNQSNTLANLLEPYHVPSSLSGAVVAIFIMVCLLGGIKRVGNISQKLVPAMFLLYSAAGLWILLCNAHKLPATIILIFQSAFTPKALTGAFLGTGFYKALRWGLAEGFYSNEAGLGIAPIPHSMAETQKVVDQGILSMVSVYSNGFLCILSGLIVLVTDVWKEPGSSFNINLLVKALSLYFPAVGPLILAICAILFAFTTILGNGYNGSQCFLYATKNRWLHWYYVLNVAIIFFGAIADIKVVWALSDFFMVPVALINVASIIFISKQERIGT